MSKGSNRRPADEAAFQSNFDRIFGKKLKEKADGSSLLDSPPTPK